MLLEPRRAAPGALLRWSRQALALNLRGAGFWLGLAVLLCLAIFASQRLPVVGGMLALVTFFGSIIVAAAVDRPGRAPAGAILEALRLHGRTILLFALLILGIGALIVLYAYDVASGRR